MTEVTGGCSHPDDQDHDELCRCSDHPEHSLTDGCPECEPGLRAVRDLAVGDKLDLEHDLYAGVDCGHPDCSRHPMVWRYEYGVVDQIEWETPDCIRVDFDNGESVGFPPDHTVVVVE